jgi:glyoxylase I family protein
MRVHHLAVLVRDLPRAETFWIDLLGLSIIRRWHEPSGAHRSTWIRLDGDAFLAIERADSAKPRRLDDQAGWHCVALAIDVSERAAIIRRLTAAGVGIERESPFSIYFRDPDGTLIAMSHYPVTAP